MRRLALVPALIVTLGLAALPALGQSAADSLYFSLGEVIEDVPGGSDPDYRYALYLPTTYAADTPSPVLFLMDPRGNALTPMRLFADAAERYGFVVMSSYHTLSDADSAFAVNARALAGLLDDAQIRFGVDVRRLYLVGFSGTAHYAWATAANLDGYLAGVVGVGDGMLIPSASVNAALAMERPFAYFSIAGDGDFNYDGARRLDAALDTTAFPHRFMTFEGRHSWPPKPLAEASVEWLQLQAMRAGLAPPDAEWIDVLHAAHLADAQALEAAGRGADALRRYREVAADFEGLADVSAAQARHAALAEDPAVQRALDRRESLAQQVFLYKRTIRGFGDAFLLKPIPHKKALRQLQIPTLRRDAEGLDRERAAAARRMLAVAYSFTSFYEPRAYLEAGDYARAAAMLRLAEAIYPGVPFTCYRRAQAEAQLGQADDAFEALRCAVAGGRITPEQLATDALLAPLRDDERFQTLLTDGRP